MAVAMAGPCAGSAATLEEAAAGVVRAFEEDLAEVPAAVGRLDGALVSLCEPLTPERVRPTYLALALRELALPEPSAQRLERALRALHAWDATLVLPDALAPVGSDLDLAWRRVQTEPASPQPGRLPRGVWWVDGVPAGIAPLERAVIVQGKDHGELRTWLVLDGQAPARWGQIRDTQQARPFFVAAGATAALAVVSAGMAGRLREIYVDGDAANAQEAARLDDWNEVLVWTAAGTGIAAAGFAISGLIVWRW